MQFASKELNALSKNIRSHVVNALGAMVNIDSASYFTASDVAFRMMEKFHSVSATDRKAFAAAVTMQLSLSFDKKLDDVKRTTNKIKPKLTTGNASYGYRIGLALGAPLVTLDTLGEHKANTDCYERLLEKKFETAIVLVDELNYSELAQLQQAVFDRMNKLHESMLNQALIRKHLSQE